MLSVGSTAIVTTKSTPPVVAVPISTIRPGSKKTSGAEKFVPSACFGQPERAMTSFKGFCITTKSKGLPDCRPL